jgi:urea carboxylase
MWKLGQMRPGDKLRFVLVTAEESYEVLKHHEEYFASATSGQAQGQVSIPSPKSQVEKSGGSLVTSSTIFREGNIRIAWAGDEFIIFELGEMTLDLGIRLQVELWERDLKAKHIPGIDYFNTCIRSSVVRFDPKVINPDEVAQIMLDLARSLQDVREIELPIRVHRMPIVPDDPWTREATEYYMRTARKEAVYLPNNGQYIARNNGRGPNAVSDALRLTPWLVIARGFFLMLPFVIVSADLS